MSPAAAAARRWLDRRFFSRPGLGRAGAGPAETLARWRLEKLAETLAWAAEHSGWYRRTLPPAALKKTLSKLKRLRDNPFGPASPAELLMDLPWTGPEHLAAEPELFLAVGQDEVAGVVSVPSSGTSGTAKRIYADSADLEETVAFFRWGMRFLAAPGRDRVALAMSPARPGNVGDLLGRALAFWKIPFLAHGFPPPAGSAAEGSWLAELIRWRPTCLVGGPSAVASLLSHPEARPLAAGLRSVLLSGEAADEALLAVLGQRLPGVRIHRHYGATETGLGGAVECAPGRWPHVRDDLWLEIVGPDGRPAAPGEAGEMFVTPLTRRAMPLIRYRPGDEGALLSAPCPCGSILPRLKTFGRLEDRLILPGGRPLRSADFAAVLFSFPFLRDYRLSLHPGPPNTLAVTLAVTAEAPAQTAPLVAARLREALNLKRSDLELAIVSQPLSEAWSANASGGKRRLERLAGPPPAAFSG